VATPTRAWWCAVGRRECEILRAKTHRAPKILKDASSPSTSESNVGSYRTLRGRPARSGTAREVNLGRVEIYWARMRALDGSASYVSARDPSDVLRERARTPERVVERTASPAPVPSSPARSPGSMADDSAARFRKALDALVYFDADASDARASSPALGDRVEARPGDRRDFLRRLASFRPGTWFAKPPAMGPVPCARRGWRNVEADVLECESCKARIILRVPPSATNDEAIAIANKTAARLDAAHEPSCGWRGAVCPVSVARFPRAPDDELRDRFARRLRALADVQDALPVVEPIDATLGDALARRLASLVQSSTTNAGTPNAGTPTPAASAPASALAVRPRVNPEPAPSLSIAPAAAESATLLALCGWEVVPTDATPPASAPGGGVKSAVLRCRLCEARDATWNFPRSVAAGASTGPGSSAAEGNAPPARKKPRASGAALIGALRGAFSANIPGNETERAGLGGDEAPRASPGLSLGLANLGFSIAGGASPSAATRAFGGAGLCPPPAFGVGATRETPFGRVPAAGAGSESPSAREGPRPEKATRDLADATTPTRTPTARASSSTPTETETDSGPSAAKRKRDDARNVAAGSATTARRASSVGGFHPIRRHRTHCPWIVVHADVDPTVAAGGSLPAAPAGLRPGWLCVLDAVAPAGLGEDAGELDVSGLAPASEEGGAGGGGAGGGVATPPGKLKDFSMYGGRAAVASYLTGNG